MELPGLKHDHLRTAREGTAAQPTTQIGNIYVQSHKDDGEPTSERRILIPGKTTLQEDKTLGDGIVDGQDADYADARSNARRRDNTSETV